MREIPGMNQASAASFDGGVAVGFASDPGMDGATAVRWTEEDGAVRLGRLGARASFANDVSADGSAIVGELSFDHGHEIFLWTADGEMTRTGIRTVVAGHPPAISADGSVIVGSRLTEPNATRSDSEAFYWTEATGVVGLGWLPGSAVDSQGFHFASATGVNGDGSVIIGRSGAFPMHTDYRGFIWTEQYGMEELQDALAARHGLGSAFAGWNLAFPYDISPNGQFITGGGYNPDGNLEAWLVRLDGPFIDLPPSGVAGDYNASGTVEQADLDLVLLNWGVPAGSIPAPWTNDLPSGNVDQDELDKVLLNWGETAARGTSAAVPEPGSALIVIVALAVVFLWKPPQRSAT
jgi:uncharacterized membrane protein